MTSRKLTVFLLAWIVIFKPLSVNTLQMSFLILSMSCGVSSVSWNAPWPSSLYRPTCFLMLLRRTLHFAW